MTTANTASTILGIGLATTGIAYCHRLVGYNAFAAPFVTGIVGAGVSLLAKKDRHTSTAAVIAATAGALFPLIGKLSWTSVRLMGAAVVLNSSVASSFFLLKNIPDNATKKDFLLLSAATATVVATSALASGVSYFTGALSFVASSVTNYLLFRN